MLGNSNMTISPAPQPQNPPAGVTNLQEDLSNRVWLFSTVFHLHSLTNQELLLPTNARLSQQAFWP